MTGEPFGLYIHIPFCSRKCAYCDFYSVTADDTLMDIYLSALSEQLEQWSQRLNGRKACSLYLGGGTPILFGAERLCKLLKVCAKHFGLEQAEITLEANPNHTDYDTLLTLRGAGYNRISFGVQSAADEELRQLTRAHTAAQARDAILSAQRAGFENISADLMLAIPGQTQQSMQHSVRFLSQLNVTHISAYLLKIEEGTPFYERRDALKLPDEDDTAALYLGAVQVLKQAGYRQYEISNFAKEGYTCRHNLLYWDCREYLGLGPAAHSFIGSERFAYPRDLQAFLAGSKPEPMGGGGEFEEYAMLRLRLNEGLAFEQAHKRYAFDEQMLLKRAQPLRQYGLCVCDENGIRLTPNGFLVSNYCIGKILA
ncbi:radical SAM family heme chaperone HemW [Acetanaerobacterium elongatum]|uniref:Heme chaperone HemW n=1 Tax=Acetanaerobacterium elongatum TaxID=258515 RepID=A0A1H0CAT2_9FIRM|nr:radical SAM family heme chaperone HemW [Acetanaerobacterium elongatum]SDN54962.1 oxygen-independent coproporphyrinogen-3 oxidase [Acetanaerobacterium elongatum]